MSPDREKARSHRRRTKGPTPVALTTPQGGRVTHLRLDPTDPDAPMLTIEPGRLQRAVNLARRKDAITPYRDAFTYKVQSQRGGGYYHVEEENGLWVCD